MRPNFIDIVHAEEDDLGTLYIWAEAQGTTVCLVIPTPDVTLLDRRRLYGHPEDASDEDVLEDIVAEHFDSFEIEGIHWRGMKNWIDRPAPDNPRRSRKWERKKVRVPRVAGGRANEMRRQRGDRG